MFSKTKKLILPLVILLVVLVPIKVFAQISGDYVCSCNTPMSPVEYYNTALDCNLDCPNHCTSHGDGGTCSIVGTQEGGRTTQEGNSTTQTGGRTETPNAELDNPLAGNETSIPNLIARVIKIILGLIGIVSLVMFIYAGFLWLTAQGNMEKIKKGKDTMLYAVIGIVIVFSSYIVLNYLFGILTF